MKNLNKIKGILAGAVLAFGLSSCSITQPYAVTEQPIGSKTGVSKTSVILGVIQLNGDYSVAEAAENGGITGPVSTVDVKTTSYVLFSTKELIVTGE